MTDQTENESGWWFFATPSKKKLVIGDQHPSFYASKNRLPIETTSRNHYRKLFCSGIIITFWKPHKLLHPHKL
jgi:hypothetical protein